MAQFPNTTAADGIWTLKKVRRAILGDNWPPLVPPDEFFANTVLLLQADDFADGSQNNTFLDSSTNTHTITRNGNVTQGSFSPFSQDEGKWGNYFDGSGDYLLPPAGSDFTLGTGNFTFEAWVYPESTDSVQGIFGIGDNVTNSVQIFYEAASERVRFNVYNGALIRSTNQSVPLNTWTHFAMVREGTGTNEFKIYINGVLDTTSTSSENLSETEPSIARSYYDLDQEYFTGYISNLRLVKGTAVYTTDFDVSTPLTDITNTSLLTCQSNRFVDNSSNAHAITVNGDPEVVPFSPFAPSTAYDPATKGGSGYFDGSGDWLTSAANVTFGTGDFTLECWVYITDAGSGFKGILSCFTSNIGPVIELYNGNWAYYMVSVGVDTGIAATENTWHHVALTRSGSTFYYFVNGAQVATGSNSTNYSCDLVTIGTLGSPTYTTGYELTGFVSNARVIKGTALYTSAFTPPTAPVTAISNTEFLCNFTNAGIYDGTGRNVLETVGDAQVDTAVKKYGTGSMQFDGTGDYLILDDASSSLALGTGDFTIEWWQYFTPDLGFESVIDYRPTGVNTASYFVLFHLNSTTLQFFAGSARINATVANSQWQHIACVRSNGTTKIYVDGTQSGASYTDSNDYLLADRRPVLFGQGFTEGGTPFNGYIDDLRITKGVARYTANFTPPAAKLPNL